MANSSATAVVNKIKKTAYRQLFEQVYGEKIWQNEDKAFNAVAQALVAYQKSETFAPRFTSKYSAYLAKKVQLCQQEAQGLKLFEAEEKGNCAACHPSQVGEQGEAPLFTDFSYDNLGVPKNEKLLFYQMAKAINALGHGYVDRGLADNPRAQDKNAELGKFKEPTLRNIALTAPYMHNGVFTDLRESVEFYNTRDVDTKRAAAEVTENVNSEELGDLKLNPQEIDDLVAFLEILTDGFVVK